MLSLGLGKGRAEKWRAEYKYREQSPKLGPRTPFWGDRLLGACTFSRSGRKQSFYQRREKLSVEGRTQETRGILLAPLGHGRGKGALPFPRDKLHGKPPWAEPGTKKGGRDSRKETQSKGKGVSH